MTEQQYMYILLREIFDQLGNEKMVKEAVDGLEWEE